MREKRRRRHFATIVLAAVGLHIPFTPVGKKVFEMVVGTDEAHGFEGSSMVLRPQTDQDKQIVLKKIETRAERIDHAALTKYKQKKNEQMKNGEAISFRQTYFDLERLNGVAPEDVAIAEKNAEAMIAHFVDEMHGKFDTAFVQKVIGEMYQENKKQYDWGQASITEYFITGKFNCKVIQPTEEIVFEGILEHVPTEDARYIHLGMRKTKQHAIATLSFDQAIQDFQMGTYALERPFRVVDTQEPGTAFISFETQKQALLSDTPVVVKATSGDVKPSPDIDVITNQPVDDGIVVDGALIGSDYVLRVAEEQGVKAEPVKRISVPELIELTIEKDDPGPQEARRFRDAVLAIQDVRPLLDLSTYKKPSLATVKALEGADLRPMLRFGVNRKVGDISRWTPDVVEEFLRTRYIGDLLVETPLTNGDETAVPEVIYEKLEKIAAEIAAKKAQRILEFYLPDSLKIKYAGHLKKKDFAHLKNLEGVIDNLDLTGMMLSPDDIDSLAALTYKSVWIDGVYVPVMQSEKKHLIEVMGRSSTFFRISVSLYDELLSEDVSILNYQNIRPNVSPDALTSGQVVNFRQSLQAVRLIQGVNVQKIDEILALLSNTFDFIQTPQDPTGSLYVSNNQNTNTK